MSKRRRVEPVASSPAAVEPPPRSSGSATVRDRDASLRQPATLLAMLVAAACVLISVTFAIRDYDLWQHLVIGKAIWQTHGVPQTNLWSWAFHDRPEVLQSWGFRALIWRFWAAGGVTGLFVWRWVLALATFGFVWAAARKAGARGLSPLVVMVLASLTYRIHVRVGPESLALLLLAIEIWILESRRHARGTRGLDPAIGLVPLAWIWVNVHDTWWIGVLILLIHLIDSALAGTRRAEPGGARPASLRTLALVTVGTIAVSFLNPFGWRALRLPFELLFHGRVEVIFQTFREYQPIAWGSHWRSGLPLLVLGWPLLIAWRALRSRLDWAETLACAVFLALLFVAQRFAAFFVVIAAFYVARDLDAWIRTLRLPVWTRGAAARAGLVALACVAVGLLEWTRPGYSPGATIDMDRYPVKAADFIAAQNIRGRGFMPTALAGYQLFRFWPERERLPFLDDPLGGTPQDRAQYTFAFSSDQAWRDLHRRHQFDYVLLDGHQESGAGDRLLDVLDADSSWSVVFRDDDAVIYVRRDGPLAPIAQRLGYIFVPGGEERIPMLGRATQLDTTIRRMAEAELKRQIASSPANARARSLLATIAWIDGRPEDARRELEATLAAHPKTAGAHQRLGLMALSTGRYEQAIEEFQKEIEIAGPSSNLSLFLGRSYQRLGDTKRARGWYQRGIALDPKNNAARESLAVLDQRPR